MFTVKDAKMFLRKLNCSYTQDVMLRVREMQKEMQRGKADDGAKRKSKKRPVARPPPPALAQASSDQSSSSAARSRAERMSMLITPNLSLAMRPAAGLIPVSLAVCGFGLLLPSLNPH